MPPSPPPLVVTLLYGPETLFSDSDNTSEPHSPPISVVRAASSPLLEADAGDEPIPVPSSPPDSWHARYAQRALASPPRRASRPPRPESPRPHPTARPPRRSPHARTLPRLPHPPRRHVAFALTETPSVAALRALNDAVSSIHRQLHVLAQRRVAERAAERAASLAGDAPATASVAAECPICFEALHNSGSSATLCGHVFHRQCLDRHFKITTTGGNCPVCRADIHPAELIHLKNGLPEGPRHAPPTSHPASPSTSAASIAMPTETIVLSDDRYEDNIVDLTTSDTPPSRPRQRECSSQSPNDKGNACKSTTSPSRDIDASLYRVLDNLEKVTERSLMFVQLEEELRADVAAHVSKAREQELAADRKCRENEQRLQQDRSDAQRRLARIQRDEDRILGTQNELNERLSEIRKQQSDLDIQQREIDGTKAELDAQREDLERFSETLRDKETRLKVLTTTMERKNAEQAETSVLAIKEECRILKATLKRHGLSVPRVAPLKPKDQTSSQISERRPSNEAFMITPPASPNPDDDLSQGMCVVAQVEERRNKRMKVNRKYGDSSGQETVSKVSAFGSLLHQPSAHCRPSAPRRGTGAGARTGAKPIAKRPALNAFAPIQKGVQRPSGGVAQKRGKAPVYGDSQRKR